MARIPLSQNDDWHLGDAPDIRGWTVQNPDGRTVGCVDDLIVNTHTHQVDSIVLDTGDRYPMVDVELRDGVVRLDRVSTPETNPETAQPPGLDDERPGDLDGSHRRAHLDPKRAKYIGEYHPRASTPADEDTS